ncbi:M15 family metallopeptidase [Arthrobacter sp. Marseille-P9274]|uniref:M15 family metallopeptidase n=1 Tax=Arthrobacter sp. Marseille-P9274 TaxID=2866572 RepID=UPI0021C6157C|nr:M15 family metallopeptidase [Arthrobacter sp. Marseille-P9274]
MNAAKPVVLAAALLGLAGLMAGCAPAGPPSPGGSTTAASPGGASASPSASAGGSPSQGAGTETSSPEPAETTASATPKGPETEEPPAQGGHDDPARIDVVVNKQRPLQPLDYFPADLATPALTPGPGGDGTQLRAATADAAEQMFAAAAADGASMTVLSGFRSYETQISTYQHWVDVNGRAGADRVSARPGFSEHQTGLSLDIGDASGSCRLEACFADTPAGSWAAQNAHRFGFVVRYQPGQESVTGYSPEPWHLRYVGTRDAGAMFSSGTKALETYYGLPAAPDYR